MPIGLKLAGNKKKGGKEMYCSNCGNKLKAEEKFCSNCGSPIAVEKVNLENPSINIQGDENNLNAERVKNSQAKQSRKSKSGNFFNNEHFNIWAGIFQVFYYIYKGLWKKGLLLQSLVALVTLFLQLFLPDGFPSEVFGLAIFATMGPIDIRRKEQKNEIMWKEFSPIFHENYFVIGITVVCLFLLSI